MGHNYMHSMGERKLEDSRREGGSRTLLILPTCPSICATSPVVFGCCSGRCFNLGSSGRKVSGLANAMSTKV